MNRKKLKKYLIKEHSESFKVGGYWIPNLVYGYGKKMGTGAFDIKKFREDQLKFQSEYEEEFLKMIEGSIEIYIQEFPIPVFNRELWYELCKVNSALDPSVINKTALSIDFFFPTRNLVVEIDGSQHWNNPTQFLSDVIRDEYLRRMYGFNIIRLRQFTREQGKKLESIGFLAPDLSSPVTLKGWEDDIVNAWEFLYKSEIIGMDWIDKNKTKDQDGLIHISIQEVERIFSQKITKEYKQRIKDLFWKLYDKKLSIP